MLKFFIFLFCAFYYCSADSAIVWNVEEKSLPTLDKLVSKASETEPVILFLFKDFDLAQFSKHASVYKENDGGDLKNLKNVIDSSKGYSVKNDEINDDILSSVEITNYDAKTDQDLSKSKVILVNMNSWKDLDSLPSAIIQRLNGRNYVAILTKQKTSSRQKRDADKEKAKLIQTKKLENMTFINNTHCLFYSQRIVFHVTNYTDPQKPVSYSCPLPRFISNTTVDPKTKSDCSNYSNSFFLEYQPNAKLGFGDNKFTLETLKLTLKIKLNKALGWWGLDSLEVEGKGSVFQPKSTFTQHFNASEVDGYMEGPVLFAYACGQQKQFVISSHKSEGKTSKDKPEEKPKVRYGISFENLQIQPFEIKPHKGGKKFIFTDDVYDCVPFISIAVWMFLVCAAILLVIVFCGIGMISSLKTMDRFDDPKGKNLVVNVKE